MAPPPLIGDAHGNFRVHIVGNCGTGKGSGRCVCSRDISTVGKQLAELLGVPFTSLDTLYWKPGWQESTNEEMREKVSRALASSPNGWVVDGNYSNKVGTLVHDRSTDTIWLDPPLILYLPRIIIRTFLRMLNLGAPCSPGCPEMLSKLFPKESIVWWCITNHRHARKREGARMAEIGMGVGSNVEGQKMRRLGGWGGELRAWLDDVKRMLQRK